MHTLLIYEFEKLKQEIKLDAVSTIKIGRNPDNHIVFDEKTISKFHAEIVVESEQVYVIDHSSNGSFIDGKRLEKSKKTLLGEKQKLQFSPNHYIIFENQKKEQITPQKTDSLADNLTTNEVYNLLQKNNKISIGRSDENDLVWASLLVSRQHAIISKEGNQFFISDLLSTNGTYINGVKIQGKVRISEDDIITIGPFSISLNPSKKEAHSLSKYSIVAQHISQKFSNGYIGLHPMSISIPKKEFVALMGPSGCGKSTLLKCLNGDNPASHGKVSINGLELNSSNFNFIKRSIGYVPQDDIVHHELTVDDTLFFSAKLRMADDVSDKEITKRINDVLGSLNINSPEIRHTKVGKLSGGQRKRVSIAVELLNDPAILFLDEPTSPLDPETIAEFLSCIQNLVKNGTSVIMVTHKPEDLNYVDNVIFLSKGGYHTYYGKPEDLLPHFKKENNIIDVYTEMNNTENGIAWNKIWLTKNPLGSDNTSIQIPYTGPITESLFKQYYWLSLRYFKIKISDSVNLALLLAQPRLPT